MPRQRHLRPIACGRRLFTGAAVAGLLALAVPSGASPLSEQLQFTARRCFASPAGASCAAVWNLSDALKQQADKRDLLRCNTSVLSVEAMVSMAEMGIQDPGHQQQALQAVAAECP